MGWFDTQIRQRKSNDDMMFRESLRDAAEMVMGEKQPYFTDDQELTSNAMEKILHYYHLEYREVPPKLKSLEDQLNYLVQPQGMMYRKISLEGKWHRDAVGAFLGFLKENNSPVALIPAGIWGYRCYDVSRDDVYLINAKTAAGLKREAYCFYRPFPQKQMNLGTLIKYILGSLRLTDFLLILAVSLLSVGVGMLVPKLTNLLYGPVLESKNVSVLMAMAVFMICVRISMLIIRTGSEIISGCVQTRLQLNIESAAMMRVLSLPAGFFRKYNSGELTSRMQSINSLCSAIVNAVLTTGLSSLVSLLYITQIFQYAAVLVVPSLIMILLTIALSIITMIFEIRRQKKIMEQEAKTLGLSFSLVNGIQKIRLSGAEKRTFAKWAKAYNLSAQLQYNPPMIIKINSVLNQGIKLIGNIVLYAIAIASAISVKDYMAFNVSYGMVMGAFSSLASIVMIFARIKPVLDMASPILETVPEIGVQGKTVTDLQGNIELNNVTFRYENGGSKIIDDLSLKIKAGEYVAIVGPSGCGKSTLMRILLGFEKPERGSVFYDGNNIEQLDLESLRRKIGTVMQNGGLFNDSIYANITISAPYLSIDEAWEAAEIACIAQDIREMPMGMHTVISEGQGGISGGQKQRLMIARAIAPKPSILIFDEATSALDNIAQKRVTEALDELHCTRLIIAHRLSTIKSCGRILFLGEGKILEEGTYDELMEKNGLFADMVQRQLLYTA